MTAAGANLIPIPVLFGNNSRLFPSLSPDGVAYAYLAPHRGALNVWRGDLRTGESQPVTHSPERSIGNYRWSATGDYILYGQDRDGDENSRIYSVRLRDGEVTDVTPSGGIRARLVALSDSRDAAVIGTSEASPEPDRLFRLDLADGSVTEVPVAEVPQAGMTLGRRGARVVRWLADGSLRVRCAVVALDGGIAIMVRDDEQAPWRLLHGAGAEDMHLTRPVGFGARADTLFVLSSVAADTVRLLEFDTRSGCFDVRYQDPVYDIHSVGIHRESRELSFALVQAERTRVVAFDENLGRDIRRLEARGGAVTVADRSRDDKTWLVREAYDSKSPEYYVFDRAADGLSSLFAQVPGLSQYSLARVEPFSFRARDDLEIHGYRTLPRNADGRPLPTVVSVHGGPWTRDVWGYGAVRQWLANRGYMCVEINFRGSSGYGKRFLRAGYREWGGRMQDDLTDGVLELVRAGLADPARLAIMGSSYGGYAALAGAAFTPDMYRCAISVNGPANLLSFVRSASAYWGPEFARLDQRVGDPEAEPDLLRSRSPLARADHIKIPILVVQGANDPRVPRQESEDMVAALKARGVPCEFIMFPDEGHGLMRPRNKVEFYRRAELFLASHLGPREPGE